MTLRNLFPIYPLSLITPRKSKTKFGTRSLYVDLPWQHYHFLQLAMSKGRKTDLTTEEVRKEWKKYVQYHKSSLTFQGKSLASIYLQSSIFSERKFLILNVNWDKFVRYLEEKAKNFMSDIETDGKNIMNLYREIWMNFFNLRGEITSPRPMYFPSSREKFFKLLKRTGDHSYIMQVLDRFENIIKPINEKLKKNVPIIELYTNNLIMNIQHLRMLIDVANIPGTYLILRNILENYVKLFVYLNISKSDNPNLVLSVMFLYEYEVDKKSRRHSLKNFEREFIKKFYKIMDSLKSEEEIYLLNLIEKFKEKHVPTLGISRQVLEAFSKRYHLEKIELSELYSACSEVIHNQPPLPFFSLFEVKFFKHFLEEYTYLLKIITEKILNEKIEFKKIHTYSLADEKTIIKESLRATYTLRTNHGEEVKDIIKRASTILQEEDFTGLDWIWVKPLTLISVFYLLSPSISRLNDFSFIEEDMKNFIEKLQPLTYKINIKNEVDKTLSILQELLLPELERYGAFSSLESLEQKRKVIFYLLLHYLPEIAKETLKVIRISR